MLALALKVYTQRMFIISEAHQNAKTFAAWDATILVCSVDTTICELRRRWNKYYQSISIDEEAKDRRETK